MTEMISLRALLERSPAITAETVSAAIEGGLLAYVSLEPEPVFSRREITEWLARGCPTDDLDCVA